MADAIPFPPRPVDNGSVMSAAELLAWHLGGQPWVEPLPELPRVPAPRMPNPSVWPEHVRAEMEAIARGEIE